MIPVCGPCLDELVEAAREGRALAVHSFGRLAGQDQVCVECGEITHIGVYLRPDPPPEASHGQPKP